MRSGRVSRLRASGANRGRKQSVILSFGEARAEIRVTTRPGLPESRDDRRKPLARYGRWARASQAACSVAVISPTATCLSPLDEDAVASDENL